jgi:hypothetical protein
MDAAGLLELARSRAPLHEQRAALGTALREKGASDEAVRAVLERARDGVVLYDDGEIHASRVGGNGFLPPGEDWPMGPTRKAMEFVAAIDLGEMSSPEPLPRTGTLLVYWAPENPRQDFVAGTYVRYVPREVPLEEHENPDPGVEVADPIPLAGVTMPIYGTAGLSLPADDDFNAVSSLYRGLGELVRFSQLLGGSRDFSIRPAVEEIAYWFKRVGFIARRRYSKEEQAGEGWTLLAQFGSNRGGLAFPEDGALYLVIPDADLRALKFDRVMGILQS